jgi:peptide/nickel transport system permease protein
MNDVKAVTIQLVARGARAAWRGLKAARKFPVVPGAVFLMFIVFAVFAPQIAPYDPVKIAVINRLKPPFFLAGGSTAHLLGTDTLGRDVLSRLIFGARVSLLVAAAVIAISVTLGFLIGVSAGYLGGRIDAFLMRIADGAIAFPALLLALLFAVSLGPSIYTVILSLSILSWALTARIIRSEVMRLRNMEFIAQARILACSRFRIVVRHLLPNVLNSLMIVVTTSVGIVVLTEAFLGFLGAGVPPPTPSWGSMVADGRDYFQSAWWISFWPGVAIALLVLSGNYIGDWLRDRLDPRLRQI